MLELDSISKSYTDGSGVRNILSEANAVFRPGGIIAIIGRSGTGKSTLLNLIAGIEKLDSGKILLDGLPIKDLGENFRRKKVGFVFQFFYLIPHLNVLENVQIGLEISGNPSPDNSPQELLEKLGVIDLKDKYPASLSGGEQQRVAVARALAHSPRILLADEPTGNLDEENSAQILSLLQESAEGADRIVLMATHDHQALSYCKERHEICKEKLQKEQR